MAKNFSHPDERRYINTDRVNVEFSKAEYIMQVMRINLTSFSRQAGIRMTIKRRKVLSEKLIIKIKLEL